MHELQRCTNFRFIATRFSFEAHKRHNLHRTQKRMRFKHFSRSDGLKHNFDELPQTASEIKVREIKKNENFFSLIASTRWRQRLKRTRNKEERANRSLRRSESDWWADDERSVSTNPPFFFFFFLSLFFYYFCRGERGGGTSFAAAAHRLSATATSCTYPSLLHPIFIRRVVLHWASSRRIFHIPRFFLAYPFWVFLAGWWHPKAT